jgi:hypothetical protein
MKLCCWYEREPLRKSDPAVAGLSGGIEAKAPLCYSQERIARTLRCNTPALTCGQLLAARTYSPAASLVVNPPLINRLAAGRARQSACDARPTMPCSSARRPSCSKLAPTADRSTADFHWDLDVRVVLRFRTQQVTRYSRVETSRRSRTSHPAVWSLESYERQ